MSYTVKGGAKAPPFCRKQLENNGVLTENAFCSIIIAEYTVICAVCLL